MMARRAVLLLAWWPTLGWCTQAPPTPAAGRDPVPGAASTPAGSAPAGAVTLAYAPPPADAAPPPPDAPVGCSYQPPQAPQPPACPAPGHDIVARVDQLLARVSVPDLDRQPTITFGCPQAAGWLVDIAEFKPAPAFRGGMGCSSAPAVGPCDTVSALWRVPPSGPPQLLPGARLGQSLDVDGDGQIESLTGDATGTTIWFDDGKRPVRTKLGGAWVPWHGTYVLAALDGRFPDGFFLPDSHVFSASPAGLVERPEVLRELWQATRAAHCPRDVVAAREPGSPPPPEPPQHTCAPPANRRASLEIEIVASVAERLRQRGSLLAEGLPAFSWGCDQPEVTALVTYCEGDIPDACLAEKGGRIHELWSRVGASMRRIDRIESSTVLMEWEPYTKVVIAAHGDVDGDGRLDPIVEVRSGEGGGLSEQLSYAAVVHHRLVPIARFKVHAQQDFGPVALPLPGTRRSVVAFPQLTGLGDVVDEGHPADWARHPPTVWQLDGASFRQLHGAAARQVIRAAPPAGR